MIDGTTLLFGLPGVRVERVERWADGTRVVHAVTASETAAACPSCGVFSTSVKGQVATSPRDIPYGESRIILRWNKTRWRCREDYCERGSFTEAIPQVPARARTTRRLRTQIGAAIGEAARSVTEVAIAHGVSWPTAHRAFVAHAEELLGEPEPTRVLGIDETRRGKPRWEHCTETGRWVRVDPWDTGFVDLAGPQGLLGQREGRTGSTVIAWLSERSVPFREGIQLIDLAVASTRRHRWKSILTKAIGRVMRLMLKYDGGRTQCQESWCPGSDTAGRRFAAVSLMRIKAATQVQVAAAFDTSPLTVWRWAQALSAAGVSALVPHRKGPRRASKLTPEVIATIAVLREQGLSLRAIGERVAVSEASVRRALSDTETETEIETETDDPATVSDETEVEAGKQPEPVGRPEPVAESVAEPVLGSVSGGVVVVLADPVDRSGERAWAAFGLIPYAPPVFTPCGRAPLAGLLLGLPALAATGLADTAHTVYGEFPNGFYSLDTMLCEGVFRALLGEARAEGAARIDPPALGRVLGLDRAPEAKTIRRKIGLLAAAGRAGDWIAAMAARHVAARPEQAAVLYVDGHVRAYQGTRAIAKTHVPRLKFPAPATVETWVADAAGDPLLVVLAQPGASLASELRRLIPQLRAMVGDERRVLVGFDRGGWSPTLFADLHAAGFDTLTWRKGPIADLDEHQFSDNTHTDEAGRTHTWALADTEVELDIADGPRQGETFAMRQISLYNTAATRQMHILTTRRDLPPGEIRYRMGSRWRQENHYRYARIHFDLDSHDSYRATDDDADRMVPNPAKKLAYRDVEKARRALHSAENASDTALLAAHSPQPGTSVVLTNAMINTINTDVHTAHATLEAAITAHQVIPARLPLAQVHPGQQVLDTETKLIHHAIRIAAFNTAQTLARAITTATGYTRADDEAHTLIRTALAGSGDIIPDGDTLHIRLDPLPAPRHTAAIDELCQALNDTHTIYPGTDLTLRYSIKSHR